MKLFLEVFAACAGFNMTLTIALYRLHKASVDKVNEKLESYVKKQDLNNIIDLQISKIDAKIEHLQSKQEDMCNKFDKITKIEVIS